MTDFYTQSNLSSSKEGLPENFLRQIRECLNSLYDFPYLQRHPLARKIHTIYEETQDSPGQLLRRKIIEGIETLNPGTDFYFRSPQARSYYILYLHYIEGLTIQKVAYEMGISERQVYRNLRDSEEMLARLLWEQWFKKNREYDHNRISTVSNDIAIQTIDLRELLYQSLQVIENLASLHRVRFDVLCPEEPISVFTDSTIARQILIHFLSHSIQKIYDTKLLIELNYKSNESILQIKFSKDKEKASIPPISPIDSLIIDLIKTLHWSIKEYCESSNLNVLEINIRSIGAILLLIDDAQGQGDLLKRYLLQTPFQVFHAKSGHEGIRLAKALTPNIIFLDVMMSQMDGWEVLQRLRNDDQTANIPIVVWSVFYDPELAISLGANRFLSKLADREEILKILKDMNLV